MAEQYTEEQLIRNKQPFNHPSGIPDWSTVHSDSSSLGKIPYGAAEWNDFQLSEAEKQDFRRNGYIANKKILSEKQCDFLLQEYEKILELKEGSPELALFYEYHKNQSDDPDNVLMHALGHWRVSRYFHDLIFHPAVLVATSQLLAEMNEEYCRVRFWHDQLFAKPAKHGGVVAWHQDYSYWTRTQPMRHLTIHIAIEDQTLENGCIHYIPGSHKWNRDGKPLPVTDFNFKDMESIKVSNLQGNCLLILVAKIVATFRPYLMRMKKGHSSQSLVSSRKEKQAFTMLLRFMDHIKTGYYLFLNSISHSTTEEMFLRSNSPRRAAVLNYFADGVVSNSEDTLLDGTCKIGKGKRMCGQFFPLVFDPVCMKTM